MKSLIRTSIFKHVNPPWNTGLSKAREDMPRKGLTASEPLKSWVDLGALCLRTQPIALSQQPPGHAQRRAVFFYVILNVCIHGMSIMALNPRSLENLKPENRTRDKQRRNFTLLPSTIDWLAKQSNASATIDRLVTERSGANSEMLQFSGLLYQSWKFLATEQGVKPVEGHPISFKELHNRCFPYLKWDRFLDLVAGVGLTVIELIPSRDKNYQVGDRSVGAVTFHGTL